jgi:uncharacterized protein
MCSERLIGPAEFSSVPVTGTLSLHQMELLLPYSCGKWKMTSSNSADQPIESTPPVSPPIPSSASPAKPSPSRSPLAQPTSGRDRIVAIDVLRGVAVLGLMAIHIIVFSQPINMLGDMRAGLPYEGANRLFIWISSVLVFGKFMFLFALLFGASVTFFDRKNPGGKLGDGAGLWYRRMAWLAAIGFLHGIFLFFGDILFLYAICGMGALWWLRRQSPGAIIGIAVAFYMLGMLLFAGVMFLSYFFVDQHDMQQIVTWQIESFGGSFLDAMKFTAFMYVTNTLVMIPFVTFWITTGIMLFGMALTKLGVLAGERSAGFYALLAVLGIGIGIPFSASMFYWVEQGDFSTAHTLTWVTLFSPMAVPTALGYLGIVMLIVKLNLLRPVQFALAAVGRMALSNYLLHSLCGAVIFQGWGFGLYNQLQFPDLAYIVIGVWTLNIVFSMIWLRLFRFGPVEWLWRSLTYLKLQPMRRSPSERIAA